MVASLHMLEVVEVVRPKELRPKDRDRKWAAAVENRSNARRGGSVPTRSDIKKSPASVPVAPVPM